MRKLILVSLAILSVLLIACAKQELVIQTKQSAEGGEMPAKTTATSYPQPQETSEQTKSEEFAEGKIPQIKYCPIEYALGYKAGSCEVSEGKLKLTFKAVGEPVSATQAKNPMDPNLLRSLPEATSKRLPTSVIRRVQDYIVDKNGYREKGQDTLLHRAYNSTPPDEAAFEFYQEYCHPNGTSHYCNTGTKTINLLRAYLRARGLLKE